MLRSSEAAYFKSPPGGPMSDRNPQAEATRRAMTIGGPSVSKNQHEKDNRITSLRIFLGRRERVSREGMAHGIRFPWAGIHI